MLKENAIMMVAVAALAGCLPTTEPIGSTEPMVPTEVRLGQMPASFSATYDATGDTVTFSDGASSWVLPRVTSWDTAGFRSYGSGSNHASVSETTSGAGSVTVDMSAPIGGAGTIFVRLSEPDLPNSGTATYTGGYIGWNGIESNFTAQSIIDGEVSLFADFDADTISGSITNRAQFDTPTITAADVTLNETSITDGAFSGTTSGGDNTYNSSTARAGVYEGLLTGPNGEEVIGGIYIVHDAPGGPFVEAGGFIAE